MPAAIHERSEPLLKRPPRSHPYARVHHDVRGQYYEFKARPELVGTAHEDFVPHRDCAGTVEFFALLRHINRPDGPFETTDSGLSQSLYLSSNSPFPHKAGWVGGRVMLMWRRLDRNCQAPAVKRLLSRFKGALRGAGRDYTHIGFVVGPFPTLFTATGRRGFQIDIEFAMWGDSFNEAMQRFPDVVDVLDRAIKACERDR